MKTPENSKEQKEKIFNRRLDFYWQYLSVYAITLLAYAVLRGTIIHTTLKIVLLDPVVLLLSLIILITAVSLVFHSLRQRSIIVGKDYIIFKSRNRTRKYFLDDIFRISISKDRRIRLRGIVKIIKIRIKHRRFPVRIRPSSFDNDLDLVQAISKLKKKKYKLQNED